MIDAKKITNIGKLRIIANRWKDADKPENNIDLNKLAEYTLKIIDDEPLIKDICNAFLCSISIKAIKDPNFDSDTYQKVDVVGVVDENVRIKDVKNVKKYKK